MSTIAKILMFFSSYLLLYIFIGIKNVCSDTIIAVIMFIISVTVLLVFIKIMKVLRTSNSKTVRIKNVRTSRDINSTFILTNIVPLLAFDFTKTEDLIYFVLLWLLLCYLYCRNNSTIYNPLLEIIGYKFYTCEIVLSDNSTKDILAIIKSKETLHTSGEYKMKIVDIDNFVKLVINT